MIFFKRNDLRDIVSGFFQGKDHHVVGYRRFRYMMFLAMIVISIVPIYVATGLTYLEYKKLLAKEQKERLRWSALGAKKSIETCVQKCKSIVRFVSIDYSFEELLNQDIASELFERLRHEYSGIVDFGVIDANGIQRVYAGPYHLEGYDYSDQEWYHNVLARRIYVSNVFLGYRQIPHFVIAVSNKLPDKEEYWVLRVTIDVKTLEEVISHRTINGVDDVFLTDTHGHLQTSSNRYGAVLEKYDDFTNSNGSEVVVFEKSSKGENVLHASTGIAGAPWVLVLTQKAYTHGEQWASFSDRLRMIFIGSSVVVLAVIFQIVNILSEQLKNSELRRQALIADAENSSKLASIGRLAAGVAHEINNPLAVINQKAGLITDLLELTEDFQHKEKLTSSADAIQNSVERCKKITHRLLGFARRMDVVFEDIDMNDLLREVLGFLEKEALYNHIDIELSFAEDLPRIVSDRGQLQQVFLNIINNAIDAVGRDGNIIIKTSLLDEDTIEVSVADSGPGIPPKLLRHIFDPFFTTKEVGKGTGLGLSITYGLVKKLGGRIDVNSQLGTGSVFKVLLPLKK